MLAEKIENDILESGNKFSGQTYQAPKQRQALGDPGTVGLTVRRTAPNFSKVSPNARGVFLGACDGKFHVRLRERYMEFMYDSLEMLNADWELD